MRLKEVVAECFYLRDELSEGRVPVDFAQRDSNTRDLYYRRAGEELPQMLAGYLSLSMPLARVIRGSARCFVLSHGVELNSANVESLVKRIIKTLSNYKGNGRVNE